MAEMMPCGTACHRSEMQRIHCEHCQLTYFDECGANAAQHIKLIDALQYTVNPTSFISDT